MAKTKNRKKALKLAMKRQGLLAKATAVFDTAVETVGSAVEKTISAGQEFVEKSGKKTKDKVLAVKSQSLEEFTSNPELQGIRSDLIETLYTEGLHSLEAFTQWTEKDLLALKGIGPATVKKLKENGIRFKN